MKYHLVLILSIFITCAQSYSQIAFIKTIDTFNDLDSGMVSANGLETLDGGYIFSGYVCDQNTGTIGADVCLVKTDLNGDTLWTRIYNGSKNEQARFIQQTTDSGYIILAATYQNSSVDGALLLKVDADGHLIWTKWYQPVGYDVWNVVQTFDGGYIFSAGSYLVKTNATGDSVWTKQFNSFSAATFVAQCADSGYVVSGRVNGNAFLMKTDANGDSVWCRAFDPIDPKLAAVLPCSDGTFLIAATSGSFGLPNSLYLVKTDTAGHFLWSKYYEGVLLEAKSVCETSDGGYLIVTAYDILRTNSSGDTLWTKGAVGLGDIPVGSSGIQTSDNGFMFTFILPSFTSPHNRIGIYKTDSLGNKACYLNHRQIGLIVPPTIESNPALTISPYPITYSTYPLTTDCLGNYSPELLNICSYTGLPNVVKSHNTDIIVSPNPATGKFTVRVRQFSMNSISIYNVFGQSVLTQNFSGSQEYLLDTDLSAGCYIVTMSNGQLNISTKLIIQ